MIPWPGHASRSFRNWSIQHFRHSESVLSGKNCIVIPMGLVGGLSVDVRHNDMMNGVVNWGSHVFLRTEAVSQLPGLGLRSCERHPNCKQ